MSLIFFYISWFETSHFIVARYLDKRYIFIRITYNNENELYLHSTSLNMLIKRITIQEIEYKVHFLLRIKVKFGYQIHSLVSITVKSPTPITCHSRCIPPTAHSMLLHVYTIRIMFIFILIIWVFFILFRFVIPVWPVTVFILRRHCCFLVSSEYEGWQRWSDRWHCAFAAGSGTEIPH